MNYNYKNASSDITQESDMPTNNCNFVLYTFETALKELVYNKFTNFNDLFILVFYIQLKC